MRREKFGVLLMLHLSNDYKKILQAFNTDILQHKPLAPLRSPDSLSFEEVGDLADK